MSVEPIVVVDIGEVDYDLPDDVGFVKAVLVQNRKGNCDEQARQQEDF